MKILLYIISFTLDIVIRFVSIKNVNPDFRVNYYVYILLYLHISSLASCHYLCDTNRLENVILSTPVNVIHISS